MSKVLIVGTGGMTPSLREAILLCSMHGHREVMVALEGDATDEAVRELGLQYDIQAVLVSEVHEGINLLSQNLESLREFDDVPKPTPLIMAYDKAVVRTKLNEDRCYPKIPPKSLKAGRR